MDSQADTSLAALDDLLRRVKPLLTRSEDDQRPVVLMLCGIAGSGKSTLAKAVVKTFPQFSRLSIDEIIASKHGLYGIDYEPVKYDEYQTEADKIFEREFDEVVSGKGRDVILDRSFYAKEDREDFKSRTESAKARWILVHLEADKSVLWQRICARREEGIDANCALDISEELLDMYCSGFEAPSGEGEIVVEML